MKTKKSDASEGIPLHRVFSPTWDPDLRVYLSVLSAKRLALLNELSFEAHQEDLTHLQVSRGVEVDREVDGRRAGRPRASEGRFDRRMLREYAGALYAAIGNAARIKGEKLTPKQIRYRMVKDILGHCTEWRYALPSSERHWIADDAEAVAERIRYLLR